MRARSSCAPWPMRGSGRRAERREGSPGVRFPCSLPRWLSWATSKDRKSLLFSRQPVIQNLPPSKIPPRCLWSSSGCSSTTGPCTLWWLPWSLHTLCKHIPRGALLVCPIVSCCSPAWHKCLVWDKKYYLSAWWGFMPLGLAGQHAWFVH